MIRKRSILLISLGCMLIFVALMGALFPFVPLIFSDAKFLSEHVSQIKEPPDAVEPLPNPDISSTSIPSARPTPIPQPPDNRLFIKKINVSVPIVEGKDASAMLYGAWRYPGTSRPHKGSNTVIFGHRFRYLPPNNTTFYNLNKLERGDEFSIMWLGKTHTYTVKETKIIQPTDFSVVSPTEKPTVTLITCTPLFSTNERLVVLGELTNASP